MSKPIVAIIGNKNEETPDKIYDVYIELNDLLFFISSSTYLMYVSFFITISFSRLLSSSVIAKLYHYPIQILNA